MSIPTSDVCFLVGAGLVYDAGLPLSVGLANKFKAHLIDQAEKANDGVYLEVYRFLNGGIRFQQGILNRDPEFPVNIEQLATAALRLKSRMDNPVAPYISGWNQRLFELESKHPQLLTGFLDAIYAKLKDWLTPESGERIAYLARLSDFCHPKHGVDVFSLNYDLCIEKALTEISGTKIANGFELNGWNPANLQNPLALRLHKLHGSLDWVDDEVFGICSLQFPRHSHAEDFEGEKPPLLIFGTDTKLTGKDPFLTLLYSFASKLNLCDILVVIGYSFNDDYLNEIIEQRLRINTKLKIIVVSPNASETVDKARFLRGSPRVTSINEGAKKALNDAMILRACRENAKELKDESPF